MEVVSVRHNLPIWVCWSSVEKGHNYETTKICKAHLHGKGIMGSKFYYHKM